MIRILNDHRRLLIVMLGLAVLVGASIGLGIYAEGRHEAQVRQSAKVQAQILADSVSAALAFGDLAAINQYTTALRENPDAESVAVYDEKGQLVAHYGPKPVARYLEHILTAKPDPAVISVQAPVTENNTRLGTVYYQERTETFATRALRYSGAGLLVVAASIMLTIMALDARALTQGNKRLRQEIADRQRAEAALRQSQKMEAVGRLTGGIASVVAARGARRF